MKKLVLLLPAVLLATCTNAVPVFAKQTVTASHYSRHDDGGKYVASGGRFNDQASTAAHKTLPFGTRVQVTNPRTGKSEIVTINDRGPYVKGRTLDLSIGTAKRLGCGGLCQVEMEIVGSNKVVANPPYNFYDRDEKPKLAEPCSDCPGSAYARAKEQKANETEAKKPDRVAKPRVVATYRTCALRPRVLYDTKPVEFLFRHPLG